MKFHRVVTQSFFCIAILSGCGSLVTHFPAAPLPKLPSSWQVSLKQNPSSPATVPFSDNVWWAVFSDIQLNELIITALVANRDIKQSTLRLRQAILKQNLSELDLYPKPSITANSSLTRSWSASPPDVNIPINGIRYDLPDSSLPPVNQSYSISGVLAYEIDIWGKVADQYSIDKSETQAARADFAIVKMTLTTSVATHYWSVAGIDQRIIRTYDSLEDTKKLYKIAKARVDAGVAAAETLRAAQLAIREKENQIKKLDNDRRDEIYALALLLDIPPQSFSLTTAHLPEITDSLPDIEAGLPVAILDQRPDIKAARIRLDNALKQLNIAEKARYPQFSLSANLSMSSEELRTLISNPLGSLALNIVLPVIDWANLHVNRETAKLQYEEAVLGFRSTLYKALVEVEAAMARYQEANTALSEASKALKEAERREGFARERYLKGYKARQTWLEERENKRRTVESVEQSHLAQLERWITLRKALGKF